MNMQPADLVRVEPVTPADVEAIAILAREIWNLHYPGIITQEQIDYMLEQRYRPPRLLEELARPGLWWEQARVDGRRVGFASALLTTADEMKLDKLYVHPDVQRRGVGAALLARTLDRARQQGCRSLVLAVNKHNERAIAAYRNYGFALRDSVRVEIGGGFVMDDYIMAKTL